MNKFLIRILSVLMLFSLLILRSSFSARISKAAISSCGASVSPNSQDISSSGTLIFSITNNDQSNIPIQALTITAPSNNFTITSATGTYAGGVEINDNGSVATIGFNGWLQPGEIGDYSVDVTTGGSAMAAASFAIQASDTFDGVTYTGCSGDTGVAITSVKAEVEKGPEPVPTPLTCSGDQHLDATGLKCVSFSPAGPPPAPPYTGGQVLGINTSTSSNGWPKLAYSGGNNTDNNVLGTDTEAADTPKPSPSPIASPEVTNEPVNTNPSLMKWILTHKKISGGIALILLAVAYGLYRLSKKNK